MKSINSSKLIYKESMIEMEAEALELLIVMDLVEARMLANISKTELAKKSGIPLNEIQDVEKGIRPLTIQTLYKLATALGKEVVIELR